MKQLIKTNFEEYGFILTEKQVEQFEKYFHFLVQENEKYNLTAITEQKEVVVKHFLDSVLPITHIPQNAKVIDVGTGAGFPGVPLKILREDIEVTLLDSLQKRINFLSQLIEILGLKNTKCVHSRAEDYVKEKREKFDVAVSRAVASIPTLAEYLIPYVKQSGKILMYKASKAEEELALGQKAIKEFGCKLESVDKYFLSEYQSERNIVVLKKVALTPTKFPRGKNLPKTKPLI